MEKVVIKLSGELFASTDSLREVIVQLKEISSKYKIGIVLGAGNLFRGDQHGKTLGLKKTTGDSAGMLATIINGLILKDLLEQQNLKVKLLSAIPVPTITDSITEEKIKCSFNKNRQASLHSYIGPRIRYLKFYN